MLLGLVLGFLIGYTTACFVLRSRKQQNKQEEQVSNNKCLNNEEYAYVYGDGITSPGLMKISVIDGVKYCGEDSYIQFESPYPPAGSLNEIGETGDRWRQITLEDPLY